MASCSSSEEDAKLQDALDNSMFDTKRLCEERSKPKKYVKSSSDDHNILNVTPEFQNFIAKHLSNLLDKTIKECNIDVPILEPDVTNGVRLFHCSTRTLKDKQFINSGSFKSKKRKRTIRVSDDDDDEAETEIPESIRHCAVSAESILRKDGTACWAPTKGEEIKYKKTRDNQLELVS